MAARITSLSTPVAAMPFPVPTVAIPSESIIEYSSIHLEGWTRHPFDMTLIPESLQERVNIILSDAHALPYDRTPAPSLDSTISAISLEMRNRNIKRGGANTPPPNIRTAEDLLGYLQPQLLELFDRLGATNRLLLAASDLANHTVGEMTRLRRARVFYHLFGLNLGEASERAKVFDTLIGGPIDDGAPAVEGGKTVVPGYHSSTSQPTARLRASRSPQVTRLAVISATRTTNATEPVGATKAGKTITTIVPAASTSASLVVLNSTSVTTAAAITTSAGETTTRLTTSEETIVAAAANNSINRTPHGFRGSNKGNRGSNHNGRNAARNSGRDTRDCDSDNAGRDISGGLAGSSTSSCDSRGMHNHDDRREGGGGGARYDASNRSSYSGGVGGGGSGDIRWNAKRDADNRVPTHK
ncbi:hypothetical protein BDK51DRAFT_26459 [Blyttiomyces helicus]|uniref:Uncharacterized protein n=1 Tax=Blyttiomyces helicus TaxID=388810 RepID=A0A4P9WF18_9FUNG|nr:hypothetical protein BDK51DRAFT_26459 [Blyttiomyces helicus]|eukprot:RKO90405.1 hypothetical protein BDK51DRAFT_26459 [Blyttiomyces helicus]